MEKKENRSKIMTGGRFGERDKVEWGSKAQEVSDHISQQLAYIKDCHKKKSHFLPRPCQNISLCCFSV